MSSLKEHDTVALLNDIPEKNLPRGLIGVIIHTFQNGPSVVEFADSDGVAVEITEVYGENLLKIIQPKLMQQSDCDLLADRLNQFSAEHGSFTEGLFSSRLIQKPAAWRSIAGESSDGLIKYDYNQDGSGEALFTDADTIPISDDDHSRLLRLAESIGVTPEHVLPFVLRDGFDQTEKVALAVKKAQQERKTHSRADVMAALEQACEAQITTFEFDVVFDLPNQDDPSQAAEIVSAQLHNATIIDSQPGRLVLACSMPDASLVGAIVSVIRDVQSAIPTAKIGSVDLTPSFLGRSNVP